MLKTLYVFVELFAGIGYTAMLYQSVGVSPSIEHVAGIG